MGGDLARSEADILRQPPAVMAGLHVLTHSILMPEVISRQDLKGTFACLRDGYSARHLGAELATAVPNTAGTASQAVTQHLQRVPRTRNKARERLRPLISPQIEADLVSWIQQNHGQRVDKQSLADAIAQSGWQVLSTTLGKHIRALVEQGLICNAPKRTFTSPEAFDLPQELDDKRVHLSRWLSSLSRTVLQRFQRTEGSALWVLRMELRPEDFQQLVLDVHQALDDYLRDRAIAPISLSESDAHEYALFAPSLMSGPTDFQRAEDTGPTWASDLILAAVGGDIGLRIGGVSAAEEVFQRIAMDLLFDLADQAEINPQHFIAKRYGLKSSNTIQTWRRGRSLIPAEGNSIANTARVNILRVQIGHILSAAWPKSASWSVLLDQLRKRDAHGRAPDPAMVKLALSQLANDDLLRVLPGREPVYALQRPDYKVSIDEVEAMRASMGEDLRAVPNMVAAVEQNHPAAEVKSGVWCIRRDEIPVVKAWLRSVVEQQWKRFSSRVKNDSAREGAENDYCRGRLIVQMRVSPITHVTRR